MKLRENPAMKAVAFIAAVAAFAATAIMGWYQLANYDALWNPDYNEGDGYSIYYLEQRDEKDITQLLNLYEQRDAGRDLSVYQEQEMARLESELSAQNTNLRWQLLSRDKTVLHGNTQESLPAQALGLYWTYYELLNIGETSEVLIDVVWERIAAGAVNVEDISNVVYTDNWKQLLEEYYEGYARGSPASGEPAVSLEPGEVNEDTVFLAADGTSNLLMVEGQDGMYLFGPCLRWMLEPNEFGMQYVNGEWIRAESQGQASLELFLWLDSSFPVDDQYREAFQSLNQWRGDRGLLLGGTVVCAVLGLVLVAYLCAACGHRRGREGIYLNWFHRLPGDLLLFLLVCGVAIDLSLAWEITLYYAYTDLSMAGQLVLMGLLAACCAALCLGGLLTVVVRCKAHTLWRNTLVWRFCHWLWNLCGEAGRALPLVWKVVLLGVGYMLFTIYTFNHYGMVWLLGTGACVVLLCLWAFQWKKIRTGAQQIIGGNPEYHIDTSRMFPDLKKHADELNNLGQTISAAVEDRLRSEHFKAELITNVSHDLKTPLTSIINYVDLLKKEHIDNPKAAEYIEVLDRKSQRLKKLTEDLVEASKASTGNLAVTLERLDLGQLLDQAVAEYLDRLEAKELSVVRTLPKHAVWVMADGRHLWRVIDNLLGNCAKYALEGTRVYLNVQEYSDSAAFSIKNISRDELNVPPERLMERFVRGDESRTAEGSGLGLSIAQSLTDLQNGRFEISIDGDLFKATVTLPKAEPPGEKG
ncbi:MAG TPA: HAMP domain-containing histidine kinase [Candidatus Enterenecus stercoripullorum]|nr:HAMP domain-containing histidine kinase [Candidatus Enterenecus stercoripullorum]